MESDFQRVTALLKEGVRKTLDTHRAKHPAEHFYAFALYDADGDCVCASANSEERYQANIKKQGLLDSHKRFYYRWGTAEWAYEGIEYGPFKEARQILRETPKDDFRAFQIQSFGASIRALQELSKEGYFGEGASRVTAFFSLSDDNNAQWLERESARRINPPAVFAAWEREWLEGMGPSAGDIEVDEEFAAAFIRAHGRG